MPMSLLTNLPQTAWVRVAEETPDWGRDMVWHSCPQADYSHIVETAIEGPFRGTHQEPPLGMEGYALRLVGEQQKIALTQVIGNRVVLMVGRQEQTENLIRDTQGRRASLKKEIKALPTIGTGAEGDETVIPAAVDYACRLVDQFPSTCFALPAPDVEATAKGEVYFEWMLERDGRLLLTVGPDGTVAYVCTFGSARSKNLGAWEDQIADLIPPCFVKLAQIHQKDEDAEEWDASKTVRP